MPPSDPLGHALLAQRLAQIPEEVAGMLRRGLPPLRPATLAAERFIVTGTGSSEAHARYFCQLINLHTPRAAAYQPLSAFVDSGPPQWWRDKTLVIFSQGLSPNAQIALRRRREFAQTVLFTATTPASARQARKPERADLLDAFLREGNELVLFPLNEEYRTLIRFVGPLCGYLACLQFAAQLPGHRVELPDPRQLQTLLATPAPEALRQAMLATDAPFRQGFNLLAAAPVSEYAQNLACKFMEGVFWQAPLISDILQFAHGPFQQMTARPRPVVILQGASPAERELVGRSQAMLAGVGVQAWVLTIAAPPPLTIFGFEMACNRLVLSLMQRYRIDQLNWPGKGRDDLLYGFCPEPVPPHCPT